jgi:hypothetical protein
MVEAAGVELEADITTIGVYEDLPNVYRMTDVFYIWNYNLTLNWWIFNMSLPERQ